MKKSLILVVIIFGIFYFNTKISFAAGPTIVGKSIKDDVVWTKDDSPYVVKGGAVTINAKIEVEPGTIIKLDHSALQFREGGKLIAKGNEDEKIVFTSYKDDAFAGDTNEDGDATKPSGGDYAWIEFYTGSEAEIKHASFLYGGSPGIIAGTVSIYRNDNVIIQNSEIKYSGYAGLFIFASNPLVENNIIANNQIGVYAWDTKDTVISNNSIYDNKAGAATNATWSNGNKLYALDNWWGAISGPYYKKGAFYLEGEDNLSGEGNLVNDGVVFRPWRESDPNIEKKKPVVLVPGIGASVNWDLMVSGILNNNWSMTSSVYDGLIQSLEAMGYEKDKDLFICYYDWRKSNSVSAQNYLKPLINKALSVSGASKVNIVAHSMGGLVSRSYIQGADYDNDIDNLILIGVPNKGASDAYSVWEGGYIPGYWESRIPMIAYIKYLEIKEGEDSFFSSIHNHIPSLKELLPVYDYVFLKDQPENILKYSEMKETNNFLSSLNEGINLLKQRVNLHIIAGDEQETVEKIPVVMTNDSPEWVDGKPEPLEIVRDSQEGDGRVLVSSTDVGLQAQTIIDDNHSGIVSKSASVIAEKLGETPGTIFDAPPIDNETAFWFASPLDVEIIDPLERIISKDKKEIPFAKYSAETDPDGFKLIIIPNLKNGQYRVNITGNGSGEFHLGTIFQDYIDYKINHESQKEGVIEKDKTIEYLLNVDLSNAEQPVEDIKPKDVISPLILINSPENGREYSNNQKVKVDYEVSDDISAESDIKKTIQLDGAEFNDGEIQLWMMKTGQHRFEVEAQDEAGNVSNSEAVFTSSASFRTLADNVGKYYDAKMIKSRKEKTFLISKLKKLEATYDFWFWLDQYDKLFWHKKKWNKITRNLEKTIERETASLAKRLQKEKNKDVSPEARDLLIDGLENITASF